MSTTLTLTPNTTLGQFTGSTALNDATVYIISQSLNGVVTLLMGAGLYTGTSIDPAGTSDGFFCDTIIFKGDVGATPSLNKSINNTTNTAILIGSYGLTTVGGLFAVFTSFTFNGVQFGDGSTNWKMNIDMDVGPNIITIINNVFVWGHTVGSSNSASFAITGLTDGSIVTVANNAAFGTITDTSLNGNFIKLRGNNQQGNQGAVSILDEQNSVNMVGVGAWMNILTDAGDTVTHTAINNIITGVATQNAFLNQTHTSVLLIGPTSTANVFSGAQSAGFNSPNAGNTSTAIYVSTSSMFIQANCTAVAVSTTSPITPDFLGGARPRAGSIVDAGAVNLQFVSGIVLHADGTGTFGTIAGVTSYQTSIDGGSNWVNCAAGSFSVAAGTTSVMVRALDAASAVIATGTGVFTPSTAGQISSMTLITGII